MPFNRPPLDLLIARSAASMQSRLPGTDAVLRRSLSGIVARMSAGTEHGLYGYLDWLARQLMPDTAEEEHLERWASIWGVSRKAAGHASGDVSITGTPGTVLPEGDDLPAFGRRPVCRRLRRHRRRRRDGNRFPFRSRRGNGGQRPDRNRSRPRFPRFRARFAGSGCGRAYRRHGRRDGRKPEKPTPRNHSEDADGRDASRLRTVGA